MPGCAHGGCTLVRRVQGYFGKRLQLLTVYGHPLPGSRWDMRTSYSHTLDLLSRGTTVGQQYQSVEPTAVLAVSLKRDCALVC